MIKSWPDELNKKPRQTSFMVLVDSSGPLLHQAPGQHLTWLWDAPHPRTWTPPSEWTANCSLWKIAAAWPVGSETRSVKSEKLASVVTVEVVKHNLICWFLESARAAMCQYEGFKLWIQPLCLNLFRCVLLSCSVMSLQELCYWPRVSSTAAECGTLTASKQHNHHEPE